MPGFSSQQDSIFSKGRVIVLGLIMIVVSLVYILYLFNIQVVHTIFYQNRAKAVAMRSLTVPAQRGEIYDRNADYPLAMNVDSFALYIVPAQLPDEERDAVFERLARVLGVEKSAIESKVPFRTAQYYQPIEIKSGVDLLTVTRIAEQVEDFPGVSWSSKPIRSYNDVQSLSHILGYVGNITVEELQVMFNQGYNLNSVIGKSGIEKNYDTILRGKDGKSFSTVDVRGRQVGGIDNRLETPENGKNIVLTIDRDIQKLSEEALGDRMGSVVVLKPATGEILAMVSYPWFDPNLFYSDSSDEAFRKLSLDPNHPFLNRAIQSANPPGSSFKIIMTTAVLEEEAFDPFQTIQCNGSFQLGDRSFNCHILTGHGPLYLKQALEESCNVYFFTVGLRHLGIDVIAEYSKMFGLGELTGIDVPGEIKGQVPTPQWKQQRFNSPWVGGDTLNTSIGQGYNLVTPIQLANAVALTVNRGVIYKPHFLKEIRDPTSGAVVDTIAPEILKTAPIRKETFDTVQDYMRGVIVEGTAEVVITTKAVAVAGKTGTSEVGYDDRWHAWFAANGPHGAPPEEQIVVITMVEAENEWEWWAVRAANIIFQGVFADQTYDEAIEALRWGWLHNDRRRGE
jgi:penicillin-binding protein 2